MKNIILIFLILLVVISFTSISLKASAKPESQDPGRFCLGKYHCVNGDCENGATDPFIQSIPENEAACEVDVYFSNGLILPFFESVECKSGVCVFGIPFGPVKVFSYPTSDDIVRITIKVNDREFQNMPIIMKGYPYP